MTPRSVRNNDFYLLLRRLHVTSGFTPGIVLADVLLPPGTGPSKLGNAAPRPTIPVALADATLAR